MKGVIKLIILLFIIRISGQECNQIFSKQMSILRGNYQNLAQYSSGAIISSRKNNFFYGDSLFRDSVYFVLWNYGFTGCFLGISVDIVLIQKYLLNTLKIWLQDRGDAIYNIIIYAKVGLQENKIYDSNSAIGIVTIKFPDQYVQEFRILNFGGNNVNEHLHIIKFEAFYKENHKI